MGMISKRLGWVLAPMLTLAVVPVIASATAAPTSIVGTAWNADNTPIKGANIRLRNVVTGQIAAVTKANDAGAFTFDNADSGSYLVELVTDSGHIRAIGNVFNLAPGETVATFVRVRTKVPWASAIFNSTVAAVATVAAAEGIAAIAPTGPCQSPPCH